MKYPNFDPVIFHVAGPFAVRWYALPYVIGLFSIIIYLRYVNKRRPFATTPQIDNIITYGLLFAIVSARLWYVIFYGLDYYLSNLSAIFFIWEGGLSFHGGLLGGIVAGAFLCRLYGVSLAKVLDNTAVVLPLPVMLGRIGNFINGELFGRPTSLAIGMVFPQDPLGLTRHPSQLYESFGEGFLLLVAMFFINRSRFVQKTEYFRTASFLLLYLLARFFLEFFREPDPQVGYFFGFLTMGQLLCLFFSFCTALFTLKLIKTSRKEAVDER